MTAFELIAHCINDRAARAYKRPCMARIIWNRRENPSKYVSDQLGITREQLGDAIHEIKAAGNLRATDGVVIYDDGTVTDERGDAHGNIYDEL